VLDLQLQENEAQLSQLKEIAKGENIKIVAWAVSAILLVLIIVVFFILLITGAQYVIERYSPLITTSGIFSVFGLIEIFISLARSMSLVGHIKELINRHIVAIKEAQTELSESTIG
jgi:hypothetical protein